MSITDALRWATGLAEDADRARADDRPPAPQGDRRAARVPGRRRARLPDPRPDERDAVGRRGPADPAGDPDRDDADGRPVHPRRAVDRAPPARQRQAHRDADPAARPRQHGPRRRARRGDDPDGRLGRRHRPGRRRARRRDHRQRPARGGPRRAALDHRRVPARRAGGADPEEAAAAATARRCVVRGAREHNLRDVDLRVPLGTFVAVTGVSGSGKSTLVTEVLYRALARELNGSREPVGAHDSLEGAEHIDKIIEIDQSPIGRTPRSNPATYVGLFTPIRELFAGVPEARVRGYTPGRFSFNVKGGRCENCKGDGILKIEMQFLPDVYVPCEVCNGKRYNREALEIHYKGRSIADVLEMTIEEALEFFSAVPNVRGQAPDAERRRARLRPPRPAGDDAVGRRGAAGQALDRAVAAGDRPDAVRPRRADDRPPLRRRREAPRGPPPARRRRQHRPRHRAQPRRHQDRRLDRRPRARRAATAAAGSSPRARRSRSPRPRARRPASTWPGSCAASRSCRCPTSRSPRRPVAADRTNAATATARTAVPIDAVAQASGRGAEPV